jgi:DNA (cytosine-5)-methyltransferase 1
MFENVRGLLYRNRWYLDQVVHKLERRGYIVEVKLLNAVDFQVPQNRERVIVVGHTGGYRYPKPLAKHITVADALGGFLLSEPAEARYLTGSMDQYVAKYEKASKCINPRDLNPNRPSRTITCRNLGGATGDMLRIKVPSGRRRRLSVREGARLQSFPDWFDFSGPEGSQFDQVGNAVPPMFSFALAKSVAAYLDAGQFLDAQSIRKEWTPTQGLLELSQ